MYTTELGKSRVLGKLPSGVRVGPILEIRSFMVQDVLGHGPATCVRIKKPTIHLPNVSNDVDLFETVWIMISRGAVRFADLVPAPDTPYQAEFPVGTFTKEDTFVYKAEMSKAPQTAQGDLEQQQTLQPSSSSESPSSSSTSYGLSRAPVQGTRSTSSKLATASTLWAG